jgi:RNA polymerase sigma-70 factor (ECF subfamily)
VDERVPEQSQQETLRTLGDDGLRELVDRYVDAWERNDVEAFAAMLAEDATFAMPPISNWYRGRDAIAQWAANWPMSGDWRWKTIRTRANGQPTLGYYTWNDREGAYIPFALNVLSLQGSVITDVTAFIARSAEERSVERFEHYPDEAVDPEIIASTFGAFGLPDRIEA